ncbi:MAG: hypothetical protein E6K95_08130 [Thaumarchaeota archaeon]|nr:MAG: hypothetical protein E6K95_08130 [Nitrososphaerota archaeon]TLY14876.1 MAG: hypothetical protein E6K86_07360 [Nitrososphaerota archaeon]
MRTGQAVGVVLVLLGFVTLYLLRDPLFRLIVFVFEFIGIVIGFILLLAGLALIFGRGIWASRKRY